MKTVFFSLFEGEKEILNKNFNEVDTLFLKEKLSIDNVENFKDAEIISVFVDSIVSKEIIENLPNLKFITTRSMGYDHIDLNICKEKNILVASVPAYGSETVAEFTFGLILNLSRKVGMAYEQLREEDDFTVDKLEGFDLCGKKIGVIGTGRIGRNVIQISRGFDMEVLAYDLYPDYKLAEKYNFKYISLEELLSNSDIITLHVPYFKENHHLINKEAISKMKKGVYLINTARGELIDTSALIWGLKEGIIAGAGLDVLEGERELKDQFEILSSEEKSSRVKDYKTLLEDHLLIDMPNVIVTPHIAFNSKEARNQILEITKENIKNFIAEKPQNLVK